MDLGSPAGVKAFSPLVSARRPDLPLIIENRSRDTFSPLPGRNTLLSPRTNAWIDLTKTKMT